MARRGFLRPALLPSSVSSSVSSTPGSLSQCAVSSAEVVLHDVLNGFGQVSAGESPGLGFEFDGPVLTVSRLPGVGVYPRRHWPARLFTLRPGQVGRYRINFRDRFVRCCCDPSWLYEEWLVHVSNGPVTDDRFVHGIPAADVDHRAHLYGGRRLVGRR